MGEIERLKVKEKQQDDQIKQLKHEITGFKEQIYLTGPRLVGQCLNTYYGYLSDVPAAKRAKTFNPSLFTQLSNVYMNPAVAYIVNPRILGEQEKVQRK